MLGVWIALLVSTEPRCKDVLANVQRVLKTPQRYDFGRDDGMCDDQIAAAASQPTHDVDGVPVSLVADGPGGSGRYWHIGVALPDNRVACIQTSTVGWRNLGDGGFPAFDPFVVPHRLTIWTSINSLPPDDDSADIPPLLLIMPIVYRLDRSGFVQDTKATKAELKKWAALFAKSAKKNGAEFPGPLHRAASEAYLSFASSSGCSK